MTSLPRVVYWNNMPTPYMVGRWNAVARRGNLHFEAWFNVRREQDRGWERSWDVAENDWLFPTRYIPSSRFAGRNVHLPSTELLKLKPDLIVSNYAGIGADAAASFVLGDLAARAARPRLTLRVLPTYGTWFARSIGRETLKHVLFRAVDGVKVPGPDGAAMARRYGVPADRIFEVSQSIDVAHFARARRIDPAERQRRREALGLTGCVFLYVGRLWSKKGLDDLFDAFALAQTGQANVSLLLCGDGIDEGRYRTRAAVMPGVVFSGFVQPLDLPTIYGLSDVLVFPTLGDPNGVVVEEAMAAGLPVISTEAAGDIQRRLPDGVAGYVVPPGQPGTLADRMGRLSADPAHRRRFGNAGAELANDRSHERYARDFEAFVAGVLAKPARRSPAAWTTRALGAPILLGGRLTRPTPATIVGEERPPVAAETTP